MGFSEEQVKGVAALKESLIDQINRHREDIEVLEKNLAILDTVLKESSYTKASQLERTTDATGAEQVAVEKPSAERPAAGSIPIKQGSDGRIIANAFVTTDQVSIVLDEKVEISYDTPPFKSFFVDRIIGEMKREDAAEAESGRLQKESVIDFIINKNGSDIREIIIKNYRQKKRADELIKTASWSLARMLENK